MRHCCVRTRRIGRFDSLRPPAEVLDEYPIQCSPDRLLYLLAKTVDFVRLSAVVAAMCFFDGTASAQLEGV